ncbi:MAG: hypothetical protein QXK88_06865 [Desulfurococcaceae archaeon]
MVEAVNCRGNVRESLAVFQEMYDLKAGLDKGDLPLEWLYGYVVDHDARALHRLMKMLALRTSASKTEYYLGALFKGEGFVLEGKIEGVVVPGVPQCFSAHTENKPLLSPRDIKAIVKLLLDRGIGHVVETNKVGLAIYCAGPLTLQDYEAGSWKKPVTCDKCHAQGTK